MRRIDVAPVAGAASSRSAGSRPGRRCRRASNVSPGSMHDRRARSSSPGRGRARGLRAGAFGRHAALALLAGEVLRADRAGDGARDGARERPAETLLPRSRVTVVSWPFLVEAGRVNAGFRAWRDRARGRCVVQIVVDRTVAGVGPDCRTRSAPRRAARRRARRLRLRAARHRSSRRARSPAPPAPNPSHPRRSAATGRIACRRRLRRPAARDLAHGLEIVADGERNALEHRAVKRPAAVAERQAADRPAGVGIEDGRALAREVRQQDQAVGARRRAAAASAPS